MLRRALAIVLLVAVAPFAAAAESGIHIVFLAGPKDHGFPGQHEYEGDLRVLQKAFETAPNISRVRTSFYIGKAPPAAEIADADVIVILSSSDRAANETHPLFPPDPSTDHHGYDADTKAYLKAYDDLVRKHGTGVVIFHYAVWAENWAARQMYLDWTGGLWVQMAGRNPVDQWSMQPVNTTHPVLNGVHPFSYRDEVFCRFLLPEDYRRTNLIVATPQKDQYGIGPQVASWAYQREDGGRAFVYGGVHFHDAMLVDDYRRLLLNGIYWAAHGTVPVDGVQSNTPTDIQPTPSQPMPPVPAPK